MTFRITDSHRAEWVQSCVSDEIINLNVWTIEDPSELDVLLNRNTTKRWKHSGNLVPAWAVAGVDPKTGERLLKGVQVKPDTPQTDAKTGKVQKYIGASKTPAAPLFLDMEDGQYWPKLITDLTAPIVITEGAKKAGAVLSQGIACISLPGVSTGGKKTRLKAELDLFANYGRSIYLAFDRDIISKRQVRNALHNLGRMLAEKGAMVYVLDWPNDHKGIDDWIAAGGKVAPRLTVAQTLAEWREQAEKDYSDDPEPCLLARRYQQVEAKLSGRVRWNRLRGCVEFDGEPAELEVLRMLLALKHNIQIPAADCDQIITYLSRQQTYSPVAEYLEGVAHEHPPDDDLLNSIASDYLGAEGQLYSTYIRKTLISAVARALQPGCKVDTVCILMGAQGVGKSTFWKVLSRDWFDDSIGNSSDKDERLKLHKAWFIEWAELETVFKRKDVSATKAFITTQVDQLRPPYGRTVMDFPRPSIIVGTTNFEEILADPTGNRRFWVVPIETDFIPLSQLAGDCDRIWAAATHAFKRGEKWTLPPELRQQAIEENANYALSDPWQNAISEYLQERDSVTSSEVLTNAIRLDLDKQTRGAEMRVANLIKTEGWAATREVVQGRRVRVWRKNKSSEKVVQVVQVVQGDLEPLNSNDSIRDNLRDNLKGLHKGCPDTKAPEPPAQGSLAVDNLGGGIKAGSDRDDVRSCGVDNLDNLDNQFPKSSRTKDFYKSLPNDALKDIHGRIDGHSADVCDPDGGLPFDVGCVVEILRAGSLIGQRATVTVVDSEAKAVEVNRDGWVAPKIYGWDEVELTL